MVAIYTDLKDKVAVVTGIGQAQPSRDPNLWGNGAATARLLAQNGVKVFGCDIKLEDAEWTKQRIREEIKDATVDVMVADVTKLPDVKALVKAVMDKYSHIDILINNVGMSRPGGPAEMSEDVSQGPNGGIGRTGY